MIFSHAYTTLIIFAPIPHIFCSHLSHKYLHMSINISFLIYSVFTFKTNILTMFCRMSSLSFLLIYLFSLYPDCCPLSPLFPFPLSCSSPPLVPSLSLQRIVLLFLTRWCSVIKISMNSTWCHYLYDWIVFCYIYMSHFLNRVIQWSAPILIT